ncbi:unnamed protein product [Pedinophyceae sp. YPF-701]|nr:unnamed protein product [Pedinophyceae sp. YPF-701]
MSIAEPAAPAPAEVDDHRAEHDDDDVMPYPSPVAHVVLGAAALAPSVLPIPEYVSIITVACLTVYVGCLRSVKQQGPEDVMSHKEAARFPLVGSVVLLSLFICLKYVPKELINLVLSVYFVVLGTIALTGAALPFLRPFAPGLYRRKLAVQIPAIPLVMSEPAELGESLLAVVTAAPMLLFCVWYFRERHWVANNAIGIAFSLMGIEELSLGTPTVGVVLLVGLFFYDIFWVFCTPVMVNVAKGLDVPIKLLFPRPGVAVGDPARMALLGLGDIVIPGMYVALMCRYDYSRGWRTRYFWSAMGGYFAGLVATIVVMMVFRAAQPALLYIVPGVLGATVGHALLQGELKELMSFSEGGGQDAKGDAKEDAGGDGKEAEAPKEPVEKKED